MKRILFSLFGCMLATGVMAQEPVYSVNIVGFNKLTLQRGALYMIASAFEDIDGDALKANDVFGTQVPPGTLINSYDGVADPSPYTTDTRAGFGGNNGWSSLITFQGFVGFWIKIPDSAPLASYDVVMKGQVPLGSTSSNVVAGGLNMLGFPYTADVVFSNTALFANSQVGDQLVLWNPATSNYSGGQYVKAGFGANPWGAGSSVVLKQGVGFWYASNTNVPKLYVEGRPYSGN